MSLIRSLFCIVALMASLAVVQTASAQRIQPFGEWDFDHDFQPFAPLVTEDYGGDALDAPTGFFFTYDRCYLNVGRSDAAPQRYNGDFAWSNRFDFGYMQENRRGWLFSAWHLVGPNDEGTNVARLGGFEANRTWRLKPFHNGSYLEPFIGARYIQYQDSFTGSMVENNIIGGQLGARWFHQKGHWLISAEVRALPAWNYQFYPEVSRGEFVIAGEARLEAAYLISQKVALRAGWDMLYFGRGIARDALHPDVGNDENMLITGLTFGITINR